MTQYQESTARTAAKRARAAAGALASLDGEKRKAALLAMRDALAQHSEEIFTANRSDLEAAGELVDTGRLSQSTYGRLKLDEPKLGDLMAGIEQIASMPELLGATTLARQLDEGLNLYRISCPIGVIAIIFESRPDVLPQITALAFKTGNAVLLKGGREADNTNRILAKVIRECLAERGITCDAVQLLSTREDVQEILGAEGDVDLIIPRGSNELVRSIQANTRIPVLGHAAGICHLYVHEDASPDMAITLALDAKTQYPSACNSIETLLIDKNIAPQLLPEVVSALNHNRVIVKCESEAITKYNLQDAIRTDQSDWGTEYGDLVLSIKVVDGVDEAIEHINKYGSGHTDTIVTSSKIVFERFFSKVNSAGVFWNASTRFADGYRYGFGAEVGISTSRLHPRGPVGIEGLVTYKYKLVGKGHVVSDYSGPSAKRFTHKTLTDEFE